MLAGMSAYTHVDLADVQPLLLACDQPAAVSLLPIKGGIENSNYFLTLPDGRELVLTLFEELSAGEAHFLGPLLTHLSAAGLPVAAPLRDTSGNWLHRLAGKPAQLAPRLQGQHPLHPDTGQCRAMGEALARLHLALRDYPLERSNAHGPDWWAAVAARWEARLPEADRQLLQATLASYGSLPVDALPQGLIHGDLFRDNMLFTGSSVSGVLDFSECGQDHWLLDIAITSNDFCREWPEDMPDPARQNAFVSGYESLRPLTPPERKALPVFLAVAALRFWLSRLEVQERNREEGRGGDHVLQKDPAEMRELLRELLKDI